MNFVEVIGGQRFIKGQKFAVAGHELPAYVMKWDKKHFTCFDTRHDMVDWFQRVRAACLSAEPKQPFKPLEVVHEGQRCGFYADIECITPETMPASEVDTLKAEVMHHVNAAYDARGLDSGQLLWSENHRGHKMSFHVVGRDVDFEGTHGKSSLAHVAKKMNRDCLELTREYPQVEFSMCGRTHRKQNLFDLVVYSNNRAMRTIYSSKKGSEDSCFMPCAGFEGRELGEWWIVRDIGSTRPVHTEPWDDAVDGPNLANVRSRNGDTGTSEDTAFRAFMTQSHTEETTATPAQVRLSKRLQAYFQDLQEDVTIRVRFRGLYSSKEGKTPVDTYRLDGTNRHCESCGGDPHTGNGAGILQLGDDVFMYRCLSGRGGELTRFSLGPDAPGQPSVHADATVTPDVQVHDSAQASPVRDAGSPVRADTAVTPAVQLQPDVQPQAQVPPSPSAQLQAQVSPSPDAQLQAQVSPSPDAQLQAQVSPPPSAQLQAQVPPSPTAQLQALVSPSPDVQPQAQVQEDSDDTGRLPSFRTIPERIILACAGMNAGKTYRAAELVERGPENPVDVGQETGREGKGDATEEYDPTTKTALSVTARVSMAETITGRFASLGFKSYKDSDEVRTAEGRRRMVCEYESLDRLVKEPTVDILIIDEARAVMKAVTCYETNSDQLIPNYEMLLRLARRCGKLIVMCADLNLDLAVTTFINDVLEAGGQQRLPPPTGFRLRQADGLMGPVIPYPPPPPKAKATVRRINVTKPILERTFIQAPLGTAEMMMISDIRHEAKVIGCFGSKGRMDAMEANVKAMFPDIRIRAYGADSPHKAELGDIETHWAEFDVIFYTSTITCALDFNQPVHKVYLFPDMFTATPRDMLQMAGRARNVTTTEIVLALPKRRKKKKGEAERPPQMYFFPLPKNMDMTAATEAEVATIVASRDAKTAIMAHMRNRFLEDRNSQTIKYLPDNMTKIWACNLAEETLKSKVWYPLFLWMVRKKGYKYRRVTRDEEAEFGVDSDKEDEDGEGDGEEEDESGGSPLDQFHVFSALDMTEAEKKMMAGIDVMSFTRDDERHLLARKIQGVATQSEIVALKKYSVQRLFREELSVDDIYTVIHKRRAIMNACSMLKLSVNERAEFFLADAHGREEYDFLRSDYLVLRHTDRLLRMLGYSGLNDRTKSVNLMALDAKPQDRETSQETKDDEDIAQLAEDVTRKLEIVRKIRRNVRFRGKTESIVKEMKSILRNLFGIHLKGSRGPRPERVFEHRLQEIDDVWRIARMENAFFDAKWKAAMARRVADVMKGSKRKRKKTSEVDGAQQLLAGRSDEIWEW